MTTKCPKCHSENPDTKQFCGDCGTQLIPPAPSKPSFTETLEAPKKELTTGSTFAGRYQIIEELGKGGMGRVYKVFDTDIKEKIALKLLKPEIAADHETIERFSNELRFSRKISHRNVCRMYDLGKAEGTHYITMEYVHGEDLKRLIRKVGQLGTGKTILIAKQVCEGLAEAHRLGVVHRDLKPQNIMVDEDGNARIMDFGIARSLRAKGITGAGIMIGTPEYMSPEQVEGKDVDQRSDIYSLGVILYEMVTGRVPFEGDTPFTIGVKHKSEMPKNPKEFNAQIADDLIRVILRCLEKDKGNRYQSVGEVRSELERIEQGLPTTERILPEKKPFTSREITVKFNMKRLFIPASAFVAIIIAAIVIWRLVPRGKVVPVPEGKPSLAVLYLENNTGDENLDHWRKGLSELLITDLSQSRYFRVLSGDRIYDILKEMNLLDAESYSSRDLAEIASRGGASHILRGGFTRAAATFRINIMIQDARAGESVGSERVEGEGEGSFYRMVDELTRRIKTNFQLSPQEISSDIDKEIGKITTASPEAFRYYSEARKHHLTTDYREAIPLYEKAVALDPGFAMAYRGMAAAYSNLGYAEKERETIQKAMELRDRISDRERYQIEGNFYYQSEKTYEKAIEAFNKLLELYPDDDLGNHYLGLIFRNLEEWEKAAEKFEKMLLTVKDVLGCGSLGGTYEALGLYDKALNLYEDFIRNVSDEAGIHRDISRNYLYQGEYRLALEEAEKSFLLDPRSYQNLLLKGDIYYLSGKPGEAESEYLKIFEVGDLIAQFQARFRLASLHISQGKFAQARSDIEQIAKKAEEAGVKLYESWAHWWIGFIYLKSGYPEKALAEIELAMKGAVEMEEISGQRYSLLFKGLSYIQLKSRSEAQNTAAELKKLIQEGMNKKARRYYLYLEGLIELEKKNFAEAIQNMKDAASLLSFQSNFYFDEHALFFDGQARAYYRAGDLEKARIEYEKITGLTTGRAIYGDIYAKSFYMLGRIFEQMGDKTKAAAGYQKFLDLWKNADPGLPEVDEARKRLAGLKAN